MSCHKLEINTHLTHAHQINCRETTAYALPTSAMKSAFIGGAWDQQNAVFFALTAEEF